MTGTFQGVGTLQFSPDNKRVYAYTGLIETSNDQSEVTMIEFTTASEYLTLLVQFSGDTERTDDLACRIYFDDVEIFKEIVLVGSALYSLNTEGPNILVPPFTTVKINNQNMSSGNVRDTFLAITGNVHGSIEQFNLEVISD